MLPRSSVEMPPKVIRDWVCIVVVCLGLRRGKGALLRRQRPSSVMGSGFFSSSFFHFFFSCLKRGDKLYA